MATDIHEYISFLHEEIDRRFPNTTRYAVAGGDSIKDWIIELREGNHRLQYCPYKMFEEADGDYEESVLRLCAMWEEILTQKTE